MNKKNLFELRKEFSVKELSEENIMNDPFEQFDNWFSEILLTDKIEANTMYLATSSSDGIPGLRTVLLKEFDNSGFVFYTNYESRKGKDLEQNPNAAVLFYWKELERQIRIEGTVVKVSKERSDNYFNSRPFESRISAVVSEQSKEIGNRKILDMKFLEMKNKYADGNVPKPEHWGGYKIIPSRFEFWQGRESRLHDRILFTKESDNWKRSRLSP